MEPQRTLTFGQRLRAHRELHLGGRPGLMPLGSSALSIGFLVDDRSTGDLAVYRATTRPVIKP